MEQGNSLTNNKAVHPRRYVPVDVVADNFSSIFLDIRFCNISFLDEAHGCGAHCPDCGEDLFGDQIKQYYILQRFTCKLCGAQSTAKKGTILQDSPLSPRQYILLAYLLAEGVSTKNISKRVGISGESVRQWKVKLSA